MEFSSITDVHQDAIATCNEMKAFDTQEGHFLGRITGIVMVAYLPHSLVQPYMDVLTVPISMRCNNRMNVVQHTLGQAFFSELQ